MPSSVNANIRPVSRVLLVLTLACVSFGQAVAETKPALIVVISGFGSDASAAQLANKSKRGRGNSGMYQLVGDLKRTGLHAHFFNWNGTSAGQFSQQQPPGTDGIVSFIRDLYSDSEQTPNRHLVLIGHSWGGHTMLEVAQRLGKEPQIDVSLAIGIDPSSLSRGERPKELPATIHRLINYHTRNAFVWGAWEGNKRIQNVDLGDPTNGFEATNGGNYAAKFDIHAHNAAERNERIHQDIAKRITELVRSPTKPSATFTNCTRE